MGFGNLIIDCDDCLLEADRSVGEHVKEAVGLDGDCLEAAGVVLEESQDRGEGGIEGLLVFHLESECG